MSIYIYVYIYINGGQFAGKFMYCINHRIFQDSPHLMTPEGRWMVIDLRTVLPGIVCFGLDISSTSSIIISPRYAIYPTIDTQLSLIIYHILSYYIYMGELQYFTNLNVSAIWGSCPFMNHDSTFGRTVRSLQFTQIYKIWLVVYLPL